MKNNGLSNSTNEFLEQDVAIRRFCAARVELDQEQERSLNWEDQFMNDIELWPIEDANTSSTCLLEFNVNEEDGLVDSFINTDCCNGGQEDLISNSIDNSTQSCGVFEENVATLSVENKGFCEEAPMIIEEGDKLLSDENASNEVVDQGVYLVNLLLSCAEAVGCRDIHLASSLLHQVLASSSPCGDSLQRVSFSFAMGLKMRLSLLLIAGPFAGAFSSGAAVDDASLISRDERKEAFQLLHQTTPYIAFGFKVANEAIYQAVQDRDSIHIIDLGMEHTLQWPSLIRNLASRGNQASTKLRITGIAGSNANCFDLESSLNSLVHDAKSFGISLELNVIKENVSPSLLTKENLNLREGEFLVMNSIMHLHKHVRESRGSLKAILQAIRKLNPALFAIVEQDANHNGPFFLGRFLESLHYYSAIFDSLEASLPRSSSQRIKIESLHFAEQIRNIVASEGLDRTERHERVDQWRRQLGRAGFQIVGLKCMSQVRMMLSVYGCEGYTLSNEKGCLLLGWKGRSIILASAWQVHSLSI